MALFSTSLATLLLVPSLVSCGQAVFNFVPSAYISKYTDESIYTACSYLLTLGISAFFTEKLVKDKSAIYRLKLALFGLSLHMIGSFFYVIVGLGGNAYLQMTLKSLVGLATGISAFSVIEYLRKIQDVVRWRVWGIKFFYFANTVNLTLSIAICQILLMVMNLSTRKYYAVGPLLSAIGLLLFVSEMRSVQSHAEAIDEFMEEYHTKQNTDGNSNEQESEQDDIQRDHLWKLGTLCFLCLLVIPAAKSFGLA